MAPPLAIITPAVHRRGGTEKCLSGLIEDLSHHYDVTLFTGDLAETDVSRCRVRKLPMLRHPRLARYLTFLLANTTVLWLMRSAGRRRLGLILATGGDCFFSDVVYAHFCCAAWAARLRQDAATLLPALGWRQRLRNLHYRAFLELAGWVEGHIYRSPARLIMAVSSGTKGELVRQYGVTPARIAVVSNAADDRMRMPEPARQQSRREIRAEQAIPPDAVALIFVGAGDWKRKGLLAVLRALAELADPQVHLLVVGREDLPFYEAECDRLGVRAVVHFCGFTSQVEHYYAAADIFVYPSQYEAFSLVTLEAAASGLPLVVTRINGTEELVRDGENGLFVEARPDDIAAKLQVLVRDPRLRERLADGARRSSRQFSRAVVLEQTRALLAGFSSVPAEARR